MNSEDIKKRIEAYVKPERQQVVIDWVAWMENKGYLIVEVDNLAIRYFDRNMNKCSCPLLLIE